MSTNTNGTVVFPPDPRTAVELYLARGLAPLPLPPRSKGERLETGWPAFRLDPTSLDAHFPAGEPRNVGILNGAPSKNAVDVDLDCMEARRAAGLLLPATGWIFGRPGSPKSHRIYRADRDLESAHVDHKDISGEMLVELRGSGGLTVFPPSLHKETGELITWHTFEGEPADVPLDTLRRSVATLASAALIARHWPAEGGRDDAALALTGGLLRGGWAEERVGPFLFAVATAAGDDESRKRAGKARGTANKLAEGKNVVGWPRLAELLGEQGDAVVRRAREWLGIAAQKNQREPATAKKGPVHRLPPFVPFPLHTLPPVLSEMVSSAAAAIGCNEALVALPAMTVAAGCIGNSRALLLKRGWIEPCILWSLVVSDSGGQKTPAYSAVVDPLVALQMDLYDVHKEQVEEHKRAMDEWQQTPKDERGQKPEQPDEPETFQTSDTTIEALGVLLEDRPKGLLVARDEMDAWFGSFARYRGKNGGTDRPQWLELHRAGTLRIDRLTRDKKRVAVRRAAVSLTGTIQLPVLARALDEEAMQAGLGARFLLAMPPRRERVWTENELPEETAQRYQNLLRGLLALPLEDQKKRKPYVLGLSSPAKRLWVEFYNSWAQEQFNADGEQAAAFAKIEAYASRFMLLHHVVSHVAADIDDKAAITEASARAGIELARWFAAEAVRIYGTLSESEEQRTSRRLVEYVRSHGGRITVAVLQRSNQRKYPTSPDAEAALESLIETGLGVWEEKPASAKGGRPTRTFVLGNAPYETYETPDDEDDLNTGDDDAATLRNVGGHADSQAEDGVSYVSSHTNHMEETSGNPPEPPDSPEGVSSPPREVSSHMASYLLIQRPADLEMVRSALEETQIVGLDTETTGLDPRSDRVRLLSLACDTTDGGIFTYVIDCFAVDPSALWDMLADKIIVAHNAVFDLSFLARLGFTPCGQVSDNMILSRLLYAGTRNHHGLADCAQRELGQDLPKVLQRSDWSGWLSDDQLTYAARDAAVLRPLLEALLRKLCYANLLDTFLLESRCLKSISWMTTHGVAVDRDAWSALAEKAKEDAARLRQLMAELAPVRPGEMFSSWNFDSPAEVKKLFGALGHQIDSTDDDTLAGIDHPIAGMMRSYREAMKKTGTYGTAWLKHLAADGRVYPKWNQHGAEASGRMSCSDPNMQQLPRDKAYRRCIIAPVGRMLVKADYSQIELRIAAKVSGDKALLEAYQQGEDLHTRTARLVLGVEEVTKDHRQLAKSLNFGLLYGMGATNFRQYAATQYGVSLTEEQATQYRAAFFKSYPGLATWHRKVGRSKDTAVETRTLAGRRRLEVTRFTEKLNTPIQGAGADGLKLALAFLWERRNQMPGAFPVLAVHDEIVLEADADHADAAATWLKTAMLDAMAPLIEPVPAEVEVKIARTWGGD